MDDKKGRGEIDTSAPFQSVKDAVNLFGESAFSADKPLFRKPNPQSAEKVLVKQTELHLAQKALNKLKEQFKSAETIREQALSELKWAKRTLDELSRKLESVNESRDSAIKATEAAKIQIEEAKPGNVSVSSSSDAQTQDIEQYGLVCKELDTAKQELQKIHQDLNEILETKTFALAKVEEAKEVTKVHCEKIELLRKEISAVNESVEQVNLACTQIRKQQSEIYAEKEIQKQSYKASMEESAKKLLALKKEFDPKFARKLEVKLTETYKEIDELQKQMEIAKASDMDSVDDVVSKELNEAKSLLEKLVVEKKSLQELVESMNNLKTEHREDEAKEAAIEYLHLKLSRSKSELEECVAEESKTKSDLEEMMLTINQISSETAAARQEAEVMRKKAKELMKEAETVHLAIEETELSLKVTLDEAEKAKAMETKALEQIKSMSAARNSTSSESGIQSITLSQEEFKSLKKKAEEFDKLAEMKVAAALAQVEAVKASEKEILEKLETKQEETEKLKTATQEALKKAAMADAAKKAVEGELKRWHERDQKKAKEAEMKMSTESSLPKQKPVVHNKKLERTKFSVVSKKVLLPKLSGIFNRKKNQVQWGSPSYLPGEEPF